MSTTQNQSACVAWSTCAPGSFVSTAGTASQNQLCSTCPGGTFSATANSASCAAWRICASSEVELAPGTSTRDRACAGAWVRQFGGPNNDFVAAVAVDDSASVFVAGQFEQAPQRVGFVRKYDAAGAEQWTRLAADAEPAAIAVDAPGNVIVAGRTFAALPGFTNAGLFDAFVRKYDPAGNELWTRQFGTANQDSALGLAVDSTGNVFVTGDTTGALPGQTAIGFAGGYDGYVIKLDPSGAQVWARQFGTLQNDSATSVAVDGAGAPVVVGWSDGAFPGFPLAFTRRAFLRRYDAMGTPVWTQQFGSASPSSTTEALDVALDPSGRVVVVGSTTGALPNQTSAGLRDSWVRGHDALGNVLWTTQFGTATDDFALAVVEAAGGWVVTGFTSGSLSGASFGAEDVFLRRLDDSGQQVWTQQWGSAHRDFAMGLAVDRYGALIVGGFTTGTLPGQSPVASNTYSDGFVWRSP